MLAQYQFQYDSTLATPTTDWFPMNVAGYDSIAITIVSANGWDGDITFWGGAGPDGLSDALWALNNAQDASSTAVVTSVVGATPTPYFENFRGTIAGLAEFGVYCASTSYVPAQGVITIKVGLYSSAK